MAISNGVTAGLADVVVIDTPFLVRADGTKVMSTYITIGGNGDIVFRNTLGDLQYVPNVSSGTIIPIAATEIVSSGTVRGILRSTTAALLGWLGSGKYQ